MSSIDSFYKEYTCSYNNPLICDRPKQTAQEVKGAKFCLECGFPATLAHLAEIKGRGIYQVTSFLGVRGLGRLYSGMQLQDKQPVVIKEYLLPNRSFNDNETSQRKETFKRVAGVNLADGRNQNFRLVNYQDAIADEKAERCYLITNDVEPSQTLGKYLIENGAMAASAVREVLNQALQTLEFLHTQKLQLPSNQVKKGLAHGNINLDSILIKPGLNRNFYIYLCDLALWENLFIPPSIPQPAPAKPEDDLKSLGLVAFYLWVGRTTNYSDTQPLDPRDAQQWPNTDDNLKQFIYRLIGLETPFESAQAARKALPQLLKEDESNSLKPSLTPKQKKRFQIPLFLLVVLAFLVLGGGIWLLFWILNKPQEDYTHWNKLSINFSDVTGVTRGNFIYTGEKNGTWNVVLAQRPENQNPLNDLLRNPIPNVKATFNYQAVATEAPNSSKPLEKVLTDNNYSFAMTSLEDNVTDDLNQKAVAYDGLLVFVGATNKEGNLPTALAGQISLENLRKIYTGKITNWQVLGGPDLSIIPYAPIEPEAIALFQKIVLNNEEQNIADFKKTVGVNNKETKHTLQQISSEVEENRNPGIISFGILSETQLQCNAYPLAIKVDGQQPSQPLFLKRDRRPVTPADNLCNKSTTYFDVNTFKTGRYLLGYPLFVVYPKDNNRSSVGYSFAHILTTRQGQCLLSKVGLVPLQYMPDMPENYVCKSLP
ncbi:MAG: substrate-binding domain-containing protein [Scytonema hyalinum WJT4-NPBG1]|jgi:ABC-type phosphate transport system substrate-binding protein|nr:substrate-binding domain-containing protein [Scytonema hyalinum WJT4-NPBG1]